MTLRKRALPQGWYPQDEEEIRRFLSPFSPQARKARAALAPHAGWAYSGAIAATAVSALDSQADTVVIIGGHLPAGLPPLFAEEDWVDSPLGTMEMDRELRSLLRKELQHKHFRRGTAADRYQDNTVEVLVPLVRYFFPQSWLLWLRLPAEMASFEAGSVLFHAGKALNRDMVVLGSSDLTHYGEHYDFSPMGTGKKALDWVREVNDRQFIESLLEGKAERILERALEDRSACCMGAVLATLGFAQAAGAGSGELLAYGTSADASGPGGEVPGSFVGYAALIWPPRQRV
ncbi:MAG: AmmeMemoRadiSam system protein B [Treponema sp.]|jgi:AmmeMemoRadiSam system protein B|nr:AmmeMemoRadiSam system protein B [Treponema sp.]